MFDFLTPTCIVGIVCAGIYGLFELYVRRKERLAIIEKIGEKLDASAFVGKLRLPGYGLSFRSFSSLKGGCLLIGCGLGLLFGFCLHLKIMDIWPLNHDLIGTGYGGSILLFGGLGLLVSFLIETRMQKHDKREE